MGGGGVLSLGGTLQGSHTGGAEKRVTTLTSMTFHFACHLMCIYKIIEEARDYRMHIRHTQVGGGAGHLHRAPSQYNNAYCSLPENGNR